MDAVLMSRVVSVALVVACTVVAARSWRRGRWLRGALIATVGVLAGLVAIRHLPEPVIVGVLLTVLGVLAVATVWPLAARPRRRSGESGRTGRVRGLS